MKAAFALCLFGAGWDGAVLAGTCAGYALSGAEPTGDPPAEAMPLDINGDGSMDALVHEDRDRTVLSLNCGDGTHASVVRSGVRLHPVEPRGGGWTRFSIGHGGSAGDRYVDTGTERYRPLTEPFMDEDREDVVLAFDGARYALDLPVCETLGLRAALLSDFRYAKDDPDDRTLSVAIREG